jgi:mannitol/fructose-specific phosphotransferase system IIA component
MLPNQEMDSQMGKQLQRTGCVVDAFHVQVYASEKSLMTFLGTLARLSIENHA